MAEKKRRSRAPVFSAIVFVLLSVLYLCVAAGISNELPEAIEYNRSRLFEGVSYSTYEELPDEAYRKKLATAAELQPAVIDGIGEVLPVAINENFFTVYNIRVGGSPITKAQVEHKTPAIVISDKAAFRMSLDKNVVGQTVRLWDREFTIVGVYQQSGGALSDVSSDLWDRVYLPYTCCEEYKNLPIDTLTAPKASYGEQALALLGMTGSNKEYYIENDLSVKHDILLNYINLYVLFITVILIIGFIRVITDIAKRTYRTLRKDYENDSLPRVLWKNRLSLLLRTLLTLVLIAIPTTLILLFQPRIVLPPSYIPMDNIFDLWHYYSTFVSRISLTNASLALGNGCYLHLFTIAAIILTALFAVLIIIGLCVALRINRLIAAEKQDHSAKK